MKRSEVTGAGFRHTVYANSAATSTVGPSLAPVWIFIEGDGSPLEIDMALPGGKEAPSSLIKASTDPTTRNPVGLRLATSTPAPAMYLTRPCYGGHQNDVGCSNSLWTSARYSNAVVQSLAAAIVRYQTLHGARPVILVGYSGGGVLAVLVADLVSTVTTVVTLSSNLDIDAWAHDSSCEPATKGVNDPPPFRGCSPFVDSMNPADAPRTRHFREFALVAGKDAIVPSHTTTRYFAQHPDAEIWSYASFDHSCCWVKTWPDIFTRVQREMLRQ